MREYLPEDQGPRFKVWGRPALPRSPGLAQAARPPPDSFEEPLQGNAPNQVNVPLLEELHRFELISAEGASSSLPFHSFPAVPDLAYQFLSLDHVHGIAILAQNSTICSHGQLHPFYSIQIHPEPKFGLQPSDHRANPYGRHPRVITRPVGRHLGRPA